MASNINIETFQDKNHLVTPTNDNSEVNHNITIERSTPPPPPTDDVGTFDFLANKDKINPARMENVQITTNEQPSFEASSNEKFVEPKEQSTPLPSLVPDYKPEPLTKTQLSTKKADLLFTLNRRNHNKSYSARTLNH